MFSKINCYRIIIDHFRTLSDANTGKVIVGDIVVFVGLPFLVAIAAFLLHIDIDEGLINLLATSLSIFAALLFNLLLLVFDIIEKGKAHQGDLKTKFLKEIFSNISFCILLSILAVIFLIIANFASTFSWFSQVLDILIVFLVSMFILTLFMILKRVHILMSKEIEPKRSS